MYYKRKCMDMDRYATSSGMNLTQPLTLSETLAEARSIVKPLSGKGLPPADPVNPEPSARRGSTPDPSAQRGSGPTLTIGKSRYVFRKNVTIIIIKSHDIDLEILYFRF
jgi:hypothetical protein